ncbi:MAG: hypothetical protein IJ410_02630 [Oscillospiraceae bacterium]|nr:hypothetical protein [Oscillospiraceae bacterium]
MKKCIISFADKEILAKMEELGFECIEVVKSACVSGPISAHSDVLYQKLNNSVIIASACQRGNFGYLAASGYTVIECENLKPGYTTESLLNFIINNEYIIYNPKTALNVNRDLKRIEVKQGYTKCSTVCVNSGAYITDDESIYKILTENKIDCLKIEKGDIRLDGYNYGFIGGASVKLNDKEILFFGDIKNKKDKASVVNFLNKYGMKAIFIENKKMTDIGSALIL